jgi:hypothetical protein
MKNPIPRIQMLDGFNEGWIAFQGGEARATFELPVMGTFEVNHGKIKAWRDYFDMNQFTSRMG